MTNGEAAAVAAEVRQITPFMHVADLEAALAFLTGVVGFTVTYREPGYAYLTLGPAALRVLESEEGAAQTGTRGFRYYLDVADVDAVFTALKPRLATLPERDVVGPRDQPYGQRELILLAPDGDCLVFGSPIVK
ncbi:MAG: VOC family protein [Parvularculaceae bacterium]|nr:VOC family protein [Parvularculaceae bacterium]